MLPHSVLQQTRCRTVLQRVVQGGDGALEALGTMPVCGNLPSSLAQSPTRRQPAQAHNRSAAELACRLGSGPTFDRTVQQSLQLAPCSAGSPSCLDEVMSPLAQRLPLLSLLEAPGWHCVSVSVAEEWWDLRKWLETSSAAA